MYTPNDIKQSVTKIDDLKRDMKTNQKKFKSEITSMDTWWRGVACKSFIDGYKDIENDIDKLYTKIDTLKDGLSKLANDVQRSNNDKKKTVI